MPWQKVRIVRQYDPDVIQGYIVDFGDKILDKSYGSKLRKMKNALSGLDA
jgi:F0F1-type ATP synthase delta subunit